MRLAADRRLDIHLDAHKLVATAGRLATPLVGVIQLGALRPAPSTILEHSLARGRCRGARPEGNERGL